MAKAYIVILWAETSTLKAGLEIPEGMVRMDVLKEAWKCDNTNVVEL